MKVLLYSEGEKIIKKSGVGRALEHQRKALSLNGVELATSKSDDYDIVHLNTYGSKSIKLVKKCKKKGIPVIVHGHSTEEDFCASFRFWTLMKPFIYRNIRRCYSRPDLIFTPTPYSKRLITAYPYVTCPVVNISNGIDLEKYSNFQLTEEDKNELRKEFDIKEGQRVVIGIGWLFARKGFPDFVDVAAKMPDVKFIWFGDKNRALYPKTTTRAMDRRTNNVLLAGFVKNETIIKMLHFTDAFMFPSYEETEGIVLLEALATKTPTLVRDIGAFDYLEDGVHLLKGKTNEEFIEKLNFIFNNDLTQMKNNGYKIVEERTLEKVGAQMKAQYEMLINNKAK